MQKRFSKKNNLAISLREKIVKAKKLSVIETNKPNSSFLKPMAELLYDRVQLVHQTEV